MDFFTAFYVFCVLFLAAFIAVMLGALWGAKIMLEYQHRRDLGWETSWHPAIQALGWKLRHDPQESM